MPQKIIKNSYNAGELSEYMAGRTDINKYHNGCSKLINAIVLPHGGVVKRSGTEYIGKSPNKCKLFPFEFSVDDVLVLEFSNLLIRFYKDGDRVYETAQGINSITNASPPVVKTDVAHGYVTGEWVYIASTTTTTALNDKIFQITKVDADEFSLQDTEGNNIAAAGVEASDSNGTVKRVYQIVSSYTSAEAFEVHVTQSADVMYIAHEDHHPQKLSRTGDTNWTIADVGFTGGPFLDENTTNDYILQFTGTITEAMTGTGDGGTSSTVFTDSGESWTVDAFIGHTIHNSTTGAEGIVTDNDSTTVTVAALVGGSRQDFQNGDVATVGYTANYIDSGRTGVLEANDRDGGSDNAPFVSVNQVGALWLLKQTRDDNTTTTADSDSNATPTDLDNAIRTKGDYTFEVSTFSGSDSAKLWRKEGNGDWFVHRTFTAATIYTATEDEDNTYYAWTRSAATIVGGFTAKNAIHLGVVKITARTDSDTVTVTAITDLHIQSNTNVTPVTSTWAEGAWSDYRGFPRTVTFFEDRLWWASNTNNPDTLWGSRSSKYEEMDFTNLGLDDDALIFPLNDNEVSQIQWMFARQVMAIGAANKEYKFGASDPDKPVTPSDRKATPQTSFGSDDIQPVILNNAIFFFQRQGRKLRAMKFDSITENFNADDATLLANTLFESAPTCMVVQRIPDSIIWVIRTDGVLLSFTYEPDEEVAGWARHITQNTSGVETPVGFYESVAVIHGSVEDEVWVSVRRIINSVTVRYVERFATRFFNEIDEAVMLDSAVIVSSAFSAQDIILASDTVRCNSGLCNSSLCGGVVA